MQVSDFDFELPPELVAQFPAPERSAARLLVVDRTSRSFVHSTVSRLADFLVPGDLLVVNDTRVFPARLLGHRVPTGGNVECLLVADLGDGRWEALMHPGQKLRPGSVVRFDRPRFVLLAEVLERLFYGRRVIKLWREDGGSVDEAIEKIGHVPLPPYIRRADEPLDRERYQTVYARARGSVAAPTAGLHLSEQMLRELQHRGVQRASVTLHIGYGTFKPVRTERVEEHKVDAEWVEIDQETADTINRAKREGRRVIAVGTTTTRALESAASGGSRAVSPTAGPTELFIYPGFEFRIVDALLTNFHLPRSSLLMLVCAFAGRDLVLSAYREAVASRYRFYSYGDAMLIT